MQRKRITEPLPRPPIADVLRELGATDVPDGSGWVKMRCPFHGADRRPSASVNHDPDVGGFYCHTCGRSGDGLKLLQTEGGLSFAEACKRARELSPEGGNRHSPTKRKRRASDLLKGTR